MKKSLLIMVAMVFMLCFSLTPSSKAAIADGTYSVNYQVNKPGTNSASIANDYFVKPAKLTVNNGKMTMQLTIKSSSWVTEFNPPGGASVISRNDGANQRVVQFNVSNANIVTIAMKIDIEDIDYHHGYSVDFVFDSSGLPEAKAPEQPKQPEPQPEPQPQPNVSSGNNASQNKPTTSDDSQTNSNSQSKPSTNNATSNDGQTDSVTTVQEDSAKEDEVTEEPQANPNEQLENPETSDSLPMIYLLVFIIAAIVFVRTKYTKTN